MTTQTANQTARLFRIRLASHEWGNELMARVARETFEARSDIDIVEVIEHAGWFLTFLRDGTIIDTANDAATLSPRAIAFCRDHPTWDFIGHDSRD